MLSRILVLFIVAYQRLLSPLVGRCCRFYPSCSAYSREAIEKHGAFKGLCLSAIRICKCHPFHPGGVDLVPEPHK